MAGFPTRPSRRSFGPLTLQDRTPVRQADQEVGAQAMSLTWWQLAGLGLVTYTAWVLFHWDGANVQIDASGEAWDPESQFVPSVQRTSAGIYVVTYAATYPDENGQSIATNLRYCEVVSQGTTIAPGVGDIASNRIITTAIHKLSDNSAFDPAHVLVRAG